MARYKEAERKTIKSTTRNQLLDAAAVEFAREGYNGANINRISLSAGFAKGTIYNYFPSKRDLVLALIDEIAADHVETVIATARPVTHPEERLIAFFTAGFRYVETHLDQAQVMINMLYGYDTELKNRLYAAYLPLFQFVGEEIIGQGVIDGDFRPVDPQAMANLLMTIYLGTASQLSETGRIWLDPHQVADFVLHALRNVS